MEFCSDIELKILIQEEGFGSLFTKPTILIKPKNFNDIWLQKDPRWVMEIMHDKDKTKRINIFSDDPEILNLRKDKKMKLSDEIITLLNAASYIMEEFGWEQFVNIGHMERSPMWKDYKNEDQKDTEEKVWIASLSQANYIETLSGICYSNNLNQEELKKIIIKKQKERLEEELLNNNQTNQRKHKI